MRSKEEILAEVRDGLNSGVITESDIRPFITMQQGVAMAQSAEPEIIDNNKHDRLSVVDVMFYIAGIVLFSTIMSVIIQSWDDGNPFIHILLSAVIGLGLWATAYFLIKSSSQNDIRRGLINALLLTGSLLTITGSYIITNDIVGGFDEINYVPLAFSFAILGGLHIGFDRLIRRDLILLMGIFLIVSSFPTLLFGFLQIIEPPVDVWSIILIISAGLLVSATRVVAKIYSERNKIRSSFDSFAAFLALMSMYVASYGDYGIVWFGILIAAVFGIFYLSIVLQSKYLLGSGSFFMVLTIITIAFKYFSGFGVTFSLIVATAGLLGSAAVAAGINKRYFKRTN